MLRVEVAIVVVVMVFILAAVLGAIAVVATGRGGELGHAEPDRPPVRLPEDRLVEAVDVNRLRFPIAFRGYRMEDVDHVLDRLAGEIAERDRQIDALGQELISGAGPAPLEGYYERATEYDAEPTADTDGEAGDVVDEPPSDYSSVWRHEAASDQRDSSA